MSKVVYRMTVSLDGFVETRDGKIDWTAPDDPALRVRKLLAQSLRLRVSFIPQSHRSRSRPAVQLSPACPRVSAHLLRSATGTSHHSIGALRSVFPCGSGMSVSVASVSKSTPATETAFSRAIRTTLVGSMMPASTRST
jgi:hypothetical protein